MFDKSKYGYHLYKKEAFVGVCAKSHPFANKTVPLEDIFSKDIVANNGAITFAYEPISRCRDDLATFSVADMQISGEFNFVYCNERVAREKINLLFSS